MYMAKKNIYIFLTCRTLLYWVGFIEIQYQIYTQETSFIHDSCLDFLVSTGSLLFTYIVYVINHVHTYKTRVYMY